MKEVNTKYTERFGTEGEVWRNRWKTGKRRKGGQLSKSHGNQHLSLQFQKPLVPTHPAITCTVPWINQHVNRPLYLRKLNLAANLDWGHRGLLTERSQPSGRKPFLSLNQSLHKPMETAAAGPTDFVNGGRLRLVIIISSYITCLFFKVLCKHQLINSLLCPMQIHWFFHGVTNPGPPTEFWMAKAQQLEQWSKWLRVQKLCPALWPSDSIGSSGPRPPPQMLNSATHEAAASLPPNNS